jgi:hypothetical protein
MMYCAVDLHRVLLNLWAAAGTYARNTVTLTCSSRSARVLLPLTCSAAVHVCQLGMIRAAAPNLLQVKELTRVPACCVALLANNRMHLANRRSAYFLQRNNGCSANRAYKTPSRQSCTCGQCGSTM